MAASFTLRVAANRCAWTALAIATGPSASLAPAARTPWRRSAPARTTADFPRCVIAHKKATQRVAFFVGRVVTDTRAAFHRGSHADQPAARYPQLADHQHRGVRAAAGHERHPG